jgi:hypothetical protein
MIFLRDISLKANIFPLHIFVNAYIMLTWRLDLLSIWSASSRPSATGRGCGC